MPEKTYVLRSWRRWACLGVSACFAAAMLVAGLVAQDSADGGAVLLTVLILLIIGGSTLPLVRYPRLVVSSRGITMRQVGWQISTTWDNVERLELQPGNEGLSLRRSLTGWGASALRIGRVLPAWYTVEQDEKVREGRWFPLQPFAWWLRHGDLQQEIERYVMQND